MSEEFRPADPERYAAALRRFDEENGRDPNAEWVAGQPHARELVQARWLTEWVLQLCPNASEELRLAARCQHLCRWQIPRGSYPATRAGYLRWREDLKKFHARKAGEILDEVGYPQATRARVQSLQLKQQFPGDPESRVLEDALCLVFLEHQFAALARKTTEEKMVNALKKAWRKMSPSAQEIAKTLEYGPEEKRVLTRALERKEPADR